MGKSAPQTRRTCHPGVQDTGNSVGASADDICSICLEPLSTEVARVECGHTFHVNCLARWRKTTIMSPSFEAFERRMETYFDDGRVGSPPSLNDWKCPLCCRETRSNPVLGAYAENASLMQRANRHPKDSVQRQEGLALASQRLLLVRG